MLASFQCITQYNGQSVGLHNYCNVNIVGEEVYTYMKVSITLEVNENVGFMECLMPSQIEIVV